MRLAGHAIGCAAAMIIAACSSSSTPSSSGDADAGADAAGSPPGQPRSFKTDVVPIFAQSCSSQSCHGDPSNEGVFIHLVVADPDAIHGKLLLESPTAKGVNYVVPGEPAKSFLFAKVNGAQDDFSGTCTVPGCGETMPPGRKIPSVQRDTIQQWIAEGAPNN